MEALTLTELDLAALANWAEVVAAATVVGGVAFAIVQLRQFERRRRDVGMVEMLHAFQTGEFVAAFRVVAALPANLTAADAAKMDPQTQEAVLRVAVVTETLGLLVHRRLLDFRTAEEFFGANVVELWSKMRGFAQHRRGAVGADAPLGWTQWLAERFAERPATREGPQTVHRDWRP